MSETATQRSVKDDGVQKGGISTKKDKMLMAAIDLGTTFSGYAFSTRADYKKDKTKISLNHKWVAGTMSLISQKAPTAVLFNPEGKFDSFGYEAEDNYANLALDMEHSDWYFFKRFKMGLHDKKINRSMVIKDDTGKTMNAMKVFGAIISHLKTDLLEQIKKGGSWFVEKDIHWILTVPAIWTDSAKQFMREAAYTADIDGGQLSIALEPEAASIYCQVTHGENATGTESARLSLVLPGTKYMVIDLGGGTADITVHERQKDGTLKEMHKATGGAWGGTKVDEEFYQLLIRIIGAPVFSEFCDEHKSDHIDLQREFETKKRTISQTSKGKITLKVPVKMTEIYKKVEKESVEKAIEGSPYNGKLTCVSDKMRISADIFKNLFKPCTEKIIAHIKDLLKHPKVEGTNIFLMVGGFSESQMMQSAIIEAFPKVKVIIPDDAGLAVVKGAVVFGHSPGIESRVSKYTYGINISPPFDPDTHPDDHRVSVGCIDRCRDVFKKYIQEGETVMVHEPRTGKHLTLKQNQKEMLLKIFASPSKDPRFVDDDDCENLGKLVVNLPDSINKIRVEVRMMFGETELAVEAEELETHNKFRAYFDFL